MWSHLYTHWLVTLISNLSVIWIESTMWADKWIDRAIWWQTQQTTDWKQNPPPSVWGGCVYCHQWKLNLVTRGASNKFEKLWYVTKRMRSIVWTTTLKIIMVHPKITQCSRMDWLKPCDNKKRKKKEKKKDFKTLNNSKNDTRVNQKFTECISCNWSS